MKNNKNYPCAYCLLREVQKYFVHVPIRSPRSGPEVLKRGLIEEVSAKMRLRTIICPILRKCCTKLRMFSNKRGSNPLHSLLESVEYNKCYAGSACLVLKMISPWNLWNICHGTLNYNQSINQSMSCILVFENQASERLW